MGREAAFAETDCEGGFAAAAVTEGDDFCYVVPWLGHGGRVVGSEGE
jgi:hypothetical protein